MPGADISRADARGNVGRSRPRTSPTYLPVIEPDAVVTVLADRALPGCHSDRRFGQHGCTGVKPTGTIDAATIAALQDAIAPQAGTAIGSPGPPSAPPPTKTPPPTSETS